LEILVKWKRNTEGAGAGPGSPNPLPDHGATGAPAGVPGGPPPPLSGWEHCALPVRSRRDAVSSAAFSACSC
jgi:hypothetical protein